MQMAIFVDQEPFHQSLWLQGFNSSKLVRKRSSVTTVQFYKDTLLLI